MLSINHWNTVINQGHIHTHTEQIFCSVHRTLFSSSAVMPVKFKKTTDSKYINPNFINSYLVTLGGLFACFRSVFSNSAYTGAFFITFRHFDRINTCLLFFYTYFVWIWMSVYATASVCLSEDNLREWVPEIICGLWALHGIEDDWILYEHAVFFEVNFTNLKTQRHPALKILKLSGILNTR